MSFPLLSGPKPVVVTTAVTTPLGVKNKGKLSKEAESLMERAVMCRDTYRDYEKASALFKLALQYAEKAGNDDLIARIIGERENLHSQKVSGSLTVAVSVPLEAEDKAKLLKEAKALMNSGSFHVARRDYEKADALLKLALRYAEKAGHGGLIASIKRELGMLYYYKTSNIAAALRMFRQVRGISFVEQYLSLPKEARNTQYDISDIATFHNTYLGFERILKNERTGGVAQKTTETAVNSTIQSTDIFKNMTKLWWTLGLRLGYQKYADRRIDSAFITQQTLDANPALPYDYAKHVDQRYPLYDIHDAYLGDAKFDLVVPTFDGALGTWPWWLRDIVPKIPLSIGAQWTRVNTTVYENYKFVDSVKDFVSDAKPASLSTMRYTAGTSFETLNIVTNDNNYTKSWYITPLLNYEHAWLTSRYKDIYGLMENGDKSRPGIISGHTESVGLRVNTPRFGYKPPFGFFTGDDAAHRLSVNFRYQGSRDPTSGRGIYQVDDTYLHSMHLGLDWDMVVLTGEDTPNLSIPLSFNYGLLDTGKVTGRTRPAYYYGLGGGVKYKQLDVRASYSFSTDGITDPARHYEGKVFGVTAGWCFK